MSDPGRYFHETWLGMVQPTEGLVVSIPALMEADATERRPLEEHNDFVALLEGDGRDRRLRDPRALLEQTLGLEGLLQYGDALPDALSLYVAEEGETFRPTAALPIPAFLREPDEGPAPSAAVEAGRGVRLLIVELPDFPRGLDSSPLPQRSKSAGAPTPTTPRSARAPSVWGPQSGPKSDRRSSRPPGPRSEDARSKHKWSDVLAFDAPESTTGAWSYPPAKKLERLLRETRVPIGLLLHRRALRLLYAPHGQAAGHIDFRIADMADVGGRPILDALVLLLHRRRLLEVPPDRQLPALLARSRQMQAEVTTALSDQVFFALETLLRGFEAADARAGGTWLRPVMEKGADDPARRDLLFDALLTVLLRLVFLLYAEDSGLLPTGDPLFRDHYSLNALFARLERERTQHPEAMSRRFGAWPALLALFRVVYLGASHGTLQLPPREGHLFDPHRFPFLEGFDVDTRAVPLSGDDVAAREAAQVPTVDDETIYRVLHSLIVLGGARLSYRALQVEQIGSVYEGLMGFGTERVVSPSVRIKPSDGKHAAVWVSVEELLGVKKAQREKWLKAHAGLRGKRAKELCADLAALEKSGEDLEGRVLGRLQDERMRLKKSLRFAGGAAEDASHHVARPGRVVIQPGEERKRTSSHYTPPELSGPIVSRALLPLLACFGDAPTSSQILSLKVCDPAMGSGAFLVEACRFLGERLHQAWLREIEVGEFSPPDPDEDLAVYARRQVAERCLYGVDKNPVAVELAKLSLWLVTLQRSKPFTFLDHALRCGDALVGCSLDQIIDFDWASDGKKKKRKGEQLGLFDRELEIALGEALRARDEIAKASRVDTAEANRDMRTAMRDADDALSRLRVIGDVLIGAFFAEGKSKARDKERLRRKALVEAWLLDEETIGVPAELRRLASEARRILRPFHWMLEFPEVFWAGRVDPLTGERGEEPAFLDSVIGNPPFLGGGAISSNSGAEYLAWLRDQYPGEGQCDLCTFFFVRAADHIAKHGTVGLVATNSIATGDTRQGSLQWLLANEAVIYDAKDSIAWPGTAGVTISTVHFGRGEPLRHSLPARLQGMAVPVINSRMRPTPERADPVRLALNSAVSFRGSVVYGPGFTLTPEQAEELQAQAKRNAERIFPYLGGAEINTSPTHKPDRFVIHFEQMPLEEAESWPDLMRIVVEQVKPARMKLRENTGPGKHGKKWWWQFQHPRMPLYEALTPLERCLVNSQVSKHLLFAFQPTDRVFSHTLNVFPLDSHAAFATLQSRIHEQWARLLASSMKTDLRYTASDCFETFPFPRPSPNAAIPELEAIGQQLYDTRAKLMVDSQLGLTKTYNALKDPAVTERTKLPPSGDTPAIPDYGQRITHLRTLHLQMDQAVLEAYATETADPRWTQVQIPPFTTPQSPTDQALHQTYEDHILDHLFALNTERANK